MKLLFIILFFSAVLIPVFLSNATNEQKQSNFNNGMENKISDIEATIYTINLSKTENKTTFSLTFSVNNTRNESIKLTTPSSCCPFEGSVGIYPTVGKPYFKTGDHGWVTYLFTDHTFKPGITNLTRPIILNETNIADGEYYFEILMTTIYSTQYSFQSNILKVTVLENKIVMTENFEKDENLYRDTYIIIENISFVNYQSNNFIIFLDFDIKTLNGNIIYPRIKSEMLLLYLELKHLDNETFEPFFNSNSTISMPFSIPFKFKGDFGFDLNGTLDNYNLSTMPDGNYSLQFHDFNDLIYENQSSLIYIQIIAGNYSVMSVEKFNISFPIQSYATYLPDSINSSNNLSLSSELPINTSGFTILFPIITLILMVKAFKRRIE